MIKIFVFDTNSLISANLLANSVNRKAYDKARQIGIPVNSADTLAEFLEAFTRPKFEKYIPLDSRLKDISAFKNFGQMVRVSISISACRDPKDNKFL